MVRKWLTVWESVRWSGKPAGNIEFGRVNEIVVHHCVLTYRCKDLSSTGSSISWGEVN